MDLSVIAIFAVIGVMAVNQLVMRVGGLYARAALFYGLQLVNLVLGTGLILWGLPGFEQWPVVSWIIALLFFFRTVQNNNLRARWLREELLKEREQREKEIRAALARDREGEE
ncbi:MAG: hypothetical protein JRI25_13005 [Deltaproteobacteria bacterium]|nr:hypothetical protein [Deltaproteobacteria bacterium]MBW2255502.1 hypothetical protein [Deltaproteobacteria bacterium]